MGKKHRQRNDGQDRANGLRIKTLFDMDGYAEFPAAEPPRPTIEDVKRRFQPPVTLGTPKEVYEACDHQLEQCGVYTLLQHSFALGQMPQAQFLGYGVLQQISQNGLIRACVETTADDMTRNWIELKREGEQDKKKTLLDDLESENEDIIAEITAELDKLKLQKLLNDAACYVGYMGGCLIYIDTGENDPETLRLPLNVSSMSAEIRNDRPLRFVVVDPINVFPGLYNSLNPLRQDYFVPKTWWVLGQEIHSSRLIRLAANEVPTLLKPSYNFFGIAQAQILWDYVLHFQECRIASQRLLSKFSLTVMKTDIANTILQRGGLDEIDRRIRLLVRNRSNDGIEVIDKDEDMLKLETPISGVTDIVRQALEILAAINRTPAVKLLGISPSGFNATGESDIRNYYDYILSQQEKILRPAIKRILDLVQLRSFGKIDKSITFDFCALSEEDQAAEANTQKVKVDTMAVLLTNNVVSPEECRQRLADDPDSGFANIDVDDVPEPQEQENQIESIMGGEEKEEPEEVKKVDAIEA